MGERRDGKEVRKRKRKEREKAGREGGRRRVRVWLPSFSSYIRHFVWILLPAAEPVKTLVPAPGSSTAFLCGWPETCKTSR